MLFRSDFSNIYSSSIATGDVDTVYGYSTLVPGQYFDESATIPGGFTYDCTNTYASTNYIKAQTTAYMYAGNPVWFTGETFGGINTTGGNGLTQIYYITDVIHTTCTATQSGTNLITCADATYLNTNDVVWFTGSTFGGVDRLTASNTIQEYYVTKMSPTTFKISLTLGGGFVALSTATGSMTVNTSYFTVSETSGGSNTTLTTASGDMVANFGNDRMSIYTITVDPVTTIVTLTPTKPTAQTQ